MMTCDTARETFSDLYDGRLPLPAQEAVHRHLQACPACQAEWAAFQRVVLAVSDLGGAEPSPGFAARVRQQVEAPGWWERAVRWLFLPVRVKMPLHAAALLVLGLAGLLVYERSPELRKGTPPPRTLPPTAVRSQRPAPPEAPPPVAETGKPEAFTPPPLAERQQGSTTPQEAAPSAPAQAPAPASVPQGSPPEEQARGVPSARGKAAEAEPAGPAADALKRAETSAEARRDQADSASSAGKVEEAPPPGAASGAAVSPSSPAQSVPAPSTPPAAQVPAPRETSRKVLAARTPDALYSAALTDLAGQRYPQALNGFRAFIAQYPQDPKVPYARLALGDAQVAQGHPLEAIQEYDTLIRQFPQSPLVPTALFRQAQARLTLADPSGCTQLRDLADRFPRVPEAAQARDVMTKRCP